MADAVKKVRPSPESAPKSSRRAKHVATSALPANDIYAEHPGVAGDTDAETESELVRSLRSEITRLNALVQEQADTISALVRSALTHPCMLGTLASACSPARAVPSLLLLLCDFTAGLSPSNRSLAPALPAARQPYSLPPCLFPPGRCHWAFVSPSPPAGSGQHPPANPPDKARSRSRSWAITPANRTPKTAPTRDIGRPRHQS